MVTGQVQYKETRV